eukprot:TRINITY_DN466_c0_g1_i1.p1 TRINITY_DN466_c0_g1~~TRINITY_DN466_c0_g1_i1.p1  ORF type:complete len:351 (+),score=79.49 TRINITY_DN466_c0_g1_i1:678-1730(+)
MVKDFDLDTFNLPLKEDLPEDYDGALAKCFMSKDAYTADKLMLIVQGSGSVRAGQWARSLCINQTLYHGTTLPYMHRARERGYAMIINNPNVNYYVDDKGKMQKIPHSDSPEAQLVYLWRKVVSKCAAKDIVIVAHSYGGVATMHLVADPSTEVDVRDRVRAIAFTDSVHSRMWGFVKMSKKAKRFWGDIARNWTKSDEPLDTDFGIHGGVPTYSAGHEKHEHTSYACMKSVFRFLDERLPPTGDKDGASGEKSAEESKPKTPQKGSKEKLNVADEDAEDNDDEEEKSSQRKTSSRSRSGSSSASSASASSPRKRKSSSSGPDEEKKEEAEEKQADSMKETRSKRHKKSE